MNNNCPFCNIKSEYYVLENQECYALYDLNPVTKGHMLIIPKRHYASFFDASDSELLSIKSLIFEARALLKKEDKNISGFNIGINIGTSAGQTVHHLHWHLIPRRDGDMKDAEASIHGVLSSI